MLTVTRPSRWCGVYVWRQLPLMHVAGRRRRRRPRSPPAIDQRQPRAGAGQRDEQSERCGTELAQQCAARGAEPRGRPGWRRPRRAPRRRSSRRRPRRPRPRARSRPRGPGTPPGSPGTPIRPRLLGRAVHGEHPQVRVAGHEPYSPSLISVPQRRSASAVGRRSHRPDRSRHSAETRKRRPRRPAARHTAPKALRDQPGQRRARPPAATASVPCSLALPCGQFVRASRRAAGTPGTRSGRRRWRRRSARPPTSRCAMSASPTTRPPAR